MACYAMECGHHAAVEVCDQLMQHLHPPICLLGVSIAMKRGCHQNDSLADGYLEGASRIEAATCVTAFLCHQLISCRQGKVPRSRRCQALGGVAAERCRAVYRWRCRRLSRSPTAGGWSTRPNAPVRHPKHQEGRRFATPHHQCLFLWQEGRHFAVHLFVHTKHPQKGRPILSRSTEDGPAFPQSFRVHRRSASRRADMYGDDM